MVKRFPKTGLLMLVILGVVILAGGVAFFHRQNGR